MIFEELKYIYKGTCDFEKEKEFYSRTLGAELIWEFSRFSAKVVALKLGNSDPLTVLADHLPSDKQIFIYRTENLGKAIELLRSNGLEILGDPFGIPDGSCIRFKDESGTQYGIYEKTRPDSFLINEYARQQAEKK